MNQQHRGDCHRTCTNGVEENHHGNNRNGYTGQERVSRSDCQGHSACHPEFKDRTNRLRSFTNWVYVHVQDPSILVNYGFFFTGEKDLVRCYSCSLGLKDFTASDDPLLEHVRYSGESCEFLVRLLGPSRLREIKDSLISNYAARNTSTIRESLHNGSSTGSQHPQSRTDSTVPVSQTHRHPEYRSYSVRVSSYSIGWPTHLVQTPQTLAEAGFYFTGARDVVRCWSCDGGLQRWDPTDDPWIEHCVNFPHCAFLKETKGENYIALAHAHRNKPTTRELPTDSLNHSLENLQLQENDKKDECDRKEANIIKIQIVSMGYAPDEVTKAMDTLRKKRTDVSIESVLDEIERSRGAVKLKPKDVLKEHQKLKAQLYCMDCQIKDINTLFLPCQHHRLCSDCSDKHTICPVCGANISHKIKTYRP